MAVPKHLNQAQQRVLQTLTVLLERGEAGALPSEIANAIGTIASNTTRDLANLRHVGFVRTTDGRWYAVFPSAAAKNRKSLRLLPETVR